MMATAALPVLEAQAITKRFGGVTALCGASFELRAGEIHAICGENGAGKSTLIKLLGGVHPFGTYEGEILLEGSQARFEGVADAQEAGIAVIHQELALVPALSIAANLFLGCELRRGRFLDEDTMRVQAQEVLRKVGLAVSPDQAVGGLGVGQQQLVEIAKAMRRKPRILILDEPTAALAGREVSNLLDLLRQLRREGLTCVYISHRLEEVFALADRITVLRDGKTERTMLVGDTSPAEVIRRMVGREIRDFFPRTAPAVRGKPLLAVRGLTVASPGSRLPEKNLAEASAGSKLRAAPEKFHLTSSAAVPGSVATAKSGGRPTPVASRGLLKPRLNSIDLTLHAGEVLGIGGLMGAGRTELLLHLFGLWGERLDGTVELEGHPVLAGSPTACLAAGMALVTEDRKRNGLILDREIGFNLSLSSLRAFRRGLLLDAEAEFSANRESFRRLGMETTAKALSGGNQQKVVLGKVLMTNPRVLLLDEPTRGIDVGAKVEVYELINRLTAEGRGVILVSSELPELMGMSDRIIMMCAGAVGGVFERAEATPEALMAAAVGANLNAGLCSGTGNGFAA